MQVQKITKPNTANCYILSNEGYYIVIDPNIKLDELKKTIGEFGIMHNKEIDDLISNNLNNNSSQNKVNNILKAELNKVKNQNNKILIGVVLTHSHFDHLSALNSYIKAGVCVLGNDNCLQNMKMFKNYGIFDDFGTDMANLNEIVFITIKNFQTINVGGEVLKFVYTKGHSSCSMCLLGDASLFCGDLIFENGGIGRWDFPTGNLAELKQSLNFINGLADDITVYSGHGKNFKLGEFKPYGIY